MLLRALPSSNLQSERNAFDEVPRLMQLIHQIEKKFRSE